MIYFKQTILNQIKAASSEGEVEDVINDSVQRLKVKKVNGHIIQRFIVSMDMTLNRSRAERISAKALQNIDIAIVLFMKLQKT